MASHVLQINDLQYNNCRYHHNASSLWLHILDSGTQIISWIMGKIIMIIIEDLHKPTIIIMEL